MIIIGYLLYNPFRYREVGIVSRKKKLVKRR